MLLHEICVDAQGEQSHPRLERGKLQNLRIAAAHFDGRLLTPERGFSFWRLLGRPTQRRGFLPGTEIRDGCVVPTLGGGLCLLSGALFRLAAEMGWDIAERHGHTVAPTDFARIDATVFWPFVDLRFAPPERAALLRVRLAGGQLRVATYGEKRDVRPKLRIWRERITPTNSALQAREVQASRIYRSRAAADQGAAAAHQGAAAAHRAGAELLGLDSQRILPTGLRRNCLTCDERECHARSKLLEAL